MQYRPIRLVPFLLSFCFLIGGLQALPPDQILTMTNPGDDPVDMVYGGDILYVTTTGGRIERLDLATGTQLTPLDLGGELSGIDIDPTNSFLLVAQRVLTVTGNGEFVRVDISTGTTTSISYVPEFGGESGANDVAIMGNGKALGTTNHGGTAFTPLREIDLVTNTATSRPDALGSGGNGEVLGGTFLQRSGDYNIAYIQEDSASDGPRFQYNATADAFEHQDDSGATHFMGSANCDGSLFATQVFPDTLIEDPGYGLVHIFVGYNTGVSFDGVGERLAIANQSTDTIEIWTTSNWTAPSLSIDIDEEVGRSGNNFGAGRVQLSPSGDWVALMQPTPFPTAAEPNPIATVEVYNIPPSTPTAKNLALAPSSQVVSQLAGTTTTAVSSNRDWAVFGGDASWVTVSPTTGTGAATLTFTYAANPAPGLRSTTFAVGDQEFILVQTDGSIPFVAINPTTTNVPSATGSYAITVTSDTAWTVTGGDPWVTYTPVSGTGSGAVSVTYAGNAAPISRSTTIDIGGEAHTLNQAASAVPPGTLTLTPPTTTVSGAGGTYTITVESDEAWNAGSGSGWATVAPATGSGDGTVAITYPPYAGTAPRTSTIYVGGILHTLTQVPGPDDYPNIYTSASPAIAMGGAAGGSIENAGDVDIFRIDVPTQATVRGFSDGSTDTVGRLFAADGTSVLNDVGTDHNRASTEGWATGGSANFGIQQFLQKGTYYIRAEGFPGATGNYVVNAGWTSKSDLDGDNRPDLLWQQADSHELIYWQMDDTTAVSAQVVSAHVTPGWKAVGLGDISGDLQQDIVMQYTVDGQVNIWEMMGPTVVGGSVLTSQPPSADWEICTVQDFNADGIGDLLWRHRTNGSAAVWLMDSSLQATGSLIPPVTIGQEWRLADSADFNRDGLFDLVWQNISTGQVVVWFMDENLDFIPGGGPLPYIPGGANILVDVADYNLDGRPDAVFQNAITGEAYIWYCDDGANGTGLDVIGGGLFSSQVGTPLWQIRNSRNMHAP